MIITPNIILLLNYVIVVKNSDLKIFQSLNSIILTLTEAWDAVDWYVCIEYLDKCLYYIIKIRFDIECWTIIAIMIMWGIVSYICLPGKKYHGPPKSNGFRPEV